MIYILLFTIGFFYFFIQFALSQYFVFTDANLYLYYADQIAKGATLYKDLYMTNLPLIPYVSVLYKYITFGSLQGYYMTACIEALLSAAVLFVCLKKIYKSDFIAFIGNLFYLTTFLIFSSANHQNGNLFAVLMFTIAYLCFLYKRYVFAGIFLGLALCAKAYMLPVIAAFFVFVFIKEKKDTLPLVIGMAVTTAVILLPTLLFAYKDFVHELFGYSLTRAAGFNKWGILESFVTNDPIVAGLLVYTLIRWKRLLFPALATGFTLIFLLLYQDIYLLYLTMVVPFAVIALGDVFVSINKHPKSWELTVALTTIILLFQSFTITRYINSIQGFMTIPNRDEFISIIQKEKPQYLYGEYGIVQGVSYLSGIPMLEGVSDTNRKMFLSGVLNKDTITAKIKKTKTILIAYSYNDNIDIATASAIFNWGELKNQCKIIHSQNFTMSYPVNTIDIIKCF